VAARESETRKSSPKVADLMLRARALEVKSDSYSLSTGPQVVELYRQVLKLDSDNADAMAGLASWLATEAEDETDENVREKKSVEARDLALRAKVLDPDNPPSTSRLQAMPTFMVTGKAVYVRRRLLFRYCKRARPRTTT